MNTLSVRDDNVESEWRYLIGIFLFIMPVSFSMMHFFYDVVSFYTLEYSLIIEFDMVAGIIGGVIGGVLARAT